MSVANNQDGKTVAVNDRVSITSLVISFTGSGGLALMTLQPSTSITTYIAQANDCQAVQGAAGAVNAQPTSISGKYFGTGDNCTALGYVTSISGSGSTAILTVTLKNSGRSVLVPAGSCRSVANVS